jgi:hypothetical protein
MRSATRPMRQPIEVEADTAAQARAAHPDGSRLQHDRQREAAEASGPGARFRRISRPGIPPGRARLAAGPALHLPVLRRGCVQSRRAGGVAGCRRIQLALQPAVPPCHRRARQDAPPAGDRRGGAAQNPKSRVVYLTAEYFMWRFATAIRDNNALSLKEQLRDIDLLIIDDMQFLQGKSIQHEFCHLINMLLDSAKQVVVAADRPPGNWNRSSRACARASMAAWRSRCRRRTYRMRLRHPQARVSPAQARRPAQRLPEEILDPRRPHGRHGNGPRTGGRLQPASSATSFEPPLSIERIDEMLGHIYRSPASRAGAHRGHPARRGAPLQRVEDRASLEPPHPHHRQAAADRDVSRRR